MTYDPNRPPPPPQGQQPYGQQPPAQHPYGQPPYGAPGYGQFPYPPGYAPVGYAGMQPARPTSVAVVAIIGIVWSVLGLICMPLALVRLFKPDLFPQPAGGTDPFTDAMNAHGLLYMFMAAMNILTVVLLIVLLVGSIGALRLRPWGRTLSIGWALVNSLVVLASTIVQFIYIVPVFTTRYSADPQMRQIVFGSAVVGGIFGLLFSLALPIAILIVYRRRIAVEAFSRGER